jgi:nitrogen fixation protein NifU and related proteins
VRLRIADRRQRHARITGPCGDTDEIYLRIEEGRITSAKFTTDGCMCTAAACQAAVRLAAGRTIDECPGITRRAILEHLGGLPQDHEHCALLASLTLQKAVESYAARKK